jgi:mono/diheme cytochrome c family protein
VTARLLASAVVAALLFAGGCGVGTARRTSLSGAAAPSPSVARGELVFMAQCQSCHPGGEAGLGPALNNRALPAFAIRYQVRRGLGAMPAFSRAELPEADLDALIAYLKALRARPARPVDA